METSGKRSRDWQWGRAPVLPIVLLALRGLILVALPIEGVTGYGDFPHFFQLAELAGEGGGGLPLIGHWVEFPPLFPYLSLALYRLSGGVDHVYFYLLAILMAAFDVGNLWLFERLAKRHLGDLWAERLTWIYLGFLLIPAFGWWTFEPLSVFWLLLAAHAILGDRPAEAGLAAGLGVLTKIVPVVSLTLAWRYRSLKHCLVASAVTLGVVLVGFTPLLISNPEMSMASLRSQASKGSWETVWALLDGNLGTGVFGPIEEHLDPEQAVRARGNQARIPHWIPTLLIGGFSLWLFFQVDRHDESKALAFLSTAFCLLFLWSRGWSPQWLAYLMPLILLSLRPARALAFGLILALVSLAEWPLLLSRGRFDLLWVPVVLRSVILVLLTLELLQVVLRPLTPALARGGS